MITLKLTKRSNFLTKYINVPYVIYYATKSFLSFIFQTHLLNNPFYQILMFTLPRFFPPDFTWFNLLIGKIQCATCYNVLHIINITSEKSDTSNFLSNFFNLNHFHLLTTSNYQAST